ncbi:hypothetical protein ACWGII_37885 [Streptomyces sp. NPDC054855]
MSPEITPEHARALYAEMVPTYTRPFPRPELERVPPHGRLRVKKPLQQMTWTFPARDAATGEYAAMNVGLTAVGWGLPMAVADELGNQAATLAALAAAVPCGRQAVTLALDGGRVILGVVSLTGRQDATELEAPQDPGVVEATRGRTAMTGRLDLPAGPALVTVVELLGRGPAPDRLPAPPTGSG